VPFKSFHFRKLGENFPLGVKAGGWVQVEVIQDLIFVLDEEFHSRTKLDRG
jgi:hypothetical protein